MPIRTKMEREILFVRCSDKKGTRHYAVSFATYLVSLPDEISHHWTQYIKMGLLQTFEQKTYIVTSNCLI